jgi:lipopolysaccharide transport system ATP-binding protein
MAHAAIRTEGIGKQYLLGARAQPYRMLRDSLSAWAFAPIRAIRSRRGGARPSKSERFWALKDLSFEIERGQVVGLIGNNGSGKSTLLKILSRITDPTCGRIEIRGRVGALLEVGAGFHPELSGRENIFLNGAILGLTQTETQRRFDEIVAFAEVERFLDMPVKRYSSGMYMRLAFSVVAHLGPDVLLVDEVLAVGDAAFQKKCLAKLRTLTREGERTVVFVSHDMQAVQSLCNTAIHLEKGGVVDSGPAHSVIARYLAKVSARENTRTWEADAPGDREVQLRAVDVGPSCGYGKCVMSEDIILTLKFDASLIRRGLCVGFDIVTPEGITVFRSYQTDMAEDQSPILVAGLNILQCRIPAGLLNAGDYYLCPKLSIHNSYWIVNSDAVVRFQVEPSMGKNSDRKGILAPELLWETC